MCPGTFIPVDELNAYTKKQYKKAILINKFVILILAKHE
jgi:hypothetical protein